MFVRTSKVPHDKMVGFTLRTMGDERGTMSNGHDRAAGRVETMVTAIGSRLTAYGTRRR